jgi:hypothetical protein
MRVLQLSTHSTLLPTHGGKLRSHHIGRVLEQEGFDLRRLAFCFRVPSDLEDPREPIIDVTPMPFWQSREYKSYGPCRDYLSDYFPTFGALKTPFILAEFDRRVRAAAPELILLEHPWTWPLVVRLDEVRSGEVPVVYSSQNVECVLKRTILAEHKIVPPPEIIEGVEALERNLVANAAGVSACTRADAETFASWGARRAAVAPNGGVLRDREHLLDILPLPLDPSYAFALAVGSGHPPNISGFMNLVAPSLPLLRPNQRIVLAGSAAPEIVRSLEAQGLGHMLEGRLISLGIVDEFCLDCLIANAHALLLPIQYGSGSNVKTPEALLSGRPIITTSVAMRGFDAFRAVPGVTVADDTAAFGDALMAMLQGPFQPGCTDREALRPLLWESTVAPLVQMLREIEKSLRISRKPDIRAPDTARRVAHASSHDSI